ncbi:DAK2 domain-containing protein [Nocardioides sp.]|uniref:DAK2 domain-containing protein n=1 Tax=Nocardioides sp. TaxID=35761 RepID=UPI003D0BB268
MTDEQVATFDLAVLLRLADLATTELGEAREEIDALNVYPVPDGDTGTNMFLTMSAARDALQEATGGDPAADLRSALAAFARGALLGARGNSGVILSQLLGAMALRVARSRPDDRSALVFAQALAEATDASYAAVGVPVEGTILTVARSASNAALAAAEEEDRRLGFVVEKAAAEARAALERTPDQLPMLKQAGVVDAGGRGLCVILDAAETVLTGRVAVGGKGARRPIPVPLPTGDLTEDGPAYEVMYLLDAEDDSIAGLRTDLARLGDSLVVVGGGGLWNVHVHVDDVGAAIEAGIEAGRPHRVRVTHFADQLAGSRSRPASRRGRKVVAVAAGPGLQQLFAQAGALVVGAVPGQRPSVGMLLEAIVESGAAEVVVLPNDPDTRRSAEIAARTAEESGEVTVAVIATEAQVQGLAALAVHEPGRTFEADVLEMTATARHARHGAVTVAARRAITSGGPCEPGDILGVVDGDFVAVGHDHDAVATDIIERLIGGGGELVTLVQGAQSAGLAERCAAYLERQHPLVDVVVYDGGQERYPLLVSVE